MALARSRLDDELFFRADLPENASLIATQEVVELEPGDVLFFHCRTLHAATRNTSGTMKVSVVFTFRPGQPRPVPGSRRLRCRKFASRNDFLRRETRSILGERGEDA